MTPSTDDAFLYVPEDEVSVALALGARFIEGDARMIRPRPPPAKVAPSAFDRWRTVEARYRWALSYVARVTGDLAKTADLDEMLRSLGTTRAAHERVYLYVPIHAMDRARATDGVTWDKGRSMYYAGPKADLRLLFEWLTPAARAAWESERAMRKTVRLLVKDRAVQEASSRKSADDSSDGDGGRGGRGRQGRQTGRTATE